MVITAEELAENLILIHVNGRLDAASASTAEQEILALLEHHSLVVIDFAALEYISSAGLRVLLLAAKMMQSRAGTLLLASMCPVVREIFDISGFSAIFKIFPDATAALRQIQ